ncbi:MAG: glutamate racemase [Caldisericia bacterium]|nr:glutamate racemase [Caldisericia bacterium]
MIGIFDSGVGGLIIYQRIKKSLPWISFQYYSDHLHFPYGEKTDEQVLAYSTKISSFFVQQGCKMIVVACNTATVTAIGRLRQMFPIPFVGIVPAVKPASANGKNRKIAVLVTPLSAKSKQYGLLLEAWRHGNTMDTFEMPDLASIVEYNRFHEDSTQQYLKTFFQKLQKNGYSVVVLGCTHFLYVKHYLDTHFPDVFEVIDPIEGVAKQAKKVFLAISSQDTANLKPVNDDYYTSAEPSILEHYLDYYLHISKPIVKVISFEKPT